MRLYLFLFSSIFNRASTILGLFLAIGGALPKSNWKNVQKKSFFLINITPLSGMDVVQAITEIKSNLFLKNKY